MATQFIVVGGGIAGLTSAVALALKNCKVVLYEQTRHLGGRATTQHEKGFALNLGPHALYRNGPLHRTLREWQVPFSGHTPKLKSGAFLVAGNRKHAFPVDTRRLLLTGVFRISEKFAAMKALQRVTTQRLDRLAPQSMRDWLDENVHSTWVRLLVEALVHLTSYSNDLARLSARAAIEQVRAGVKSGVMYIDGGWETMITGLAAKAQSLGVDIQTGTPVERVEGDAVHLAGGRRVESGGTILAVTPDAAERLTGTRFRDLAPARLACLDLGLRDVPADYGRFALGFDRAFYLSMHSEFASLAPAGGALVHVGKYLAPGEQASRDELEDFAELVLPGWRGRAEVARFLPDMTVSYGLPTLGGRPDVDAVGIPGVALAGDWVGDQGMLADAAATSALRAAAWIAAPAGARAATLCAAR